MSDTVKVWIHKDEVRAQILRSPEMKALLNETASQIAQRAGDGYDYEVKEAGTRCYANVFTASAEAMRDNSDNNTLLRALK